MSEFREFTGKSLDEAIAEACSHFDMDRKKLEVEIVSGGSSGIFGLVGKKKAVIRARPRETPKQAVDFGPSETRKSERSERSGNRKSQPRLDKPRPDKPRPDKPHEDKSPADDSGDGKKAGPAVQEAASPKTAPAKTSAKAPAKASTQDAPRKREKREQERPPAGKPDPESGRRSEPSSPKPEADQQSEPPSEPQAGKSPDADAGQAREELLSQPGKPLENKELETLIVDTVSRMVEAIIGTARVTATQGTDRVKVLIEDDEDSGLLIGRDGQTINAMQYLTNRVVGKQWPEPVRVQLDTGQYRRRQDEKLRKMAHMLAQKVRSQHKPQSTRPLSSYHRRVVHLALQEDEAVQTRSKGEGPLKRVLILPKRGRGGQK